MLSFLRPLPDAPPLTDAGTIDARFKRTRVQLLVSLTLIYGFYYTCRIGLSVVKKPLIDAGIFDAKELGFIGAFLLGAYAFGKLINGVVADRVNVGRFLPLGLFLSALANLAMGANNGVLVVACVLWTFNGLFQGVGATASVVSLTQWFAARERGTVYGIWSAAHSIGEGITFVGTSALVAAFGWRAGFVSPGIACVVVAGIGLAVLFDRPGAYGLPPVWQYKGDPRPGDVEERDGTAGAHETRSAQLAVLKSPAVWICAVASALMYVTRYAVNNWGMLYLQEERGYSLVEAGSIIGVSTGFGFLGSIAYGVISDRFFNARRPPATFLFGLLECVALVVIFYGPRDTLLLSAAFAVYGFTLSGILAVLGGLFAVDLSSKKAAGMAMGLVGFVSYGGAVIQELLSGFLIHNATTTLADGTRHIDFGVPVAIWVASSVVSLLLASTLWNVRPKG